MRQMSKPRAGNGRPILNQQQIEQAYAVWSADRKKPRVERITLKAVGEIYGVSAEAMRLRFKQLTSPAQPKPTQLRRRVKDLEAEVERLRSAATNFQGGDKRQTPRRDQLMMALEGGGIHSYEDLAITMGVGIQTVRNTVAVAPGLEKFKRESDGRVYVRKV